MADGMKVIKLVPSTDPQPHPSSSSEDFKKRILFSFLVAVLFIISFASYRWFIYANTHISTNNSYVETEVWQINSRNLGYVKSVLVHENEQAKKGQVLALLDDLDVQ